MADRFWFAAALMASAASFACGGTSASQDDTTHSGAPAASAGHEEPAAGAEQRWSDAQIVAVTSAANAGEIAQANAALPKLTHAQAMQFAALMVEMHTAAQERQAALAQEQGLTPQASPLSAELAQDSNEIIEELTTAERDWIDRLYMNKQVEVHEKVLETIDDELIPSATDSALRQELQASRAEVAKHLTRAREIVENFD